MWDRAEAIKLSSADRQRLLRLARGRNTAHKLVLRARVILGAADGVANNRLARELRTSRPTVLLWRERFKRGGVEGLLRDAPRPGRKRKLSQGQVAAIVNATLHSRPPDGTHWSVRTLARAQHVSPGIVHRIWQAHGLKPHRVESFKLSTDPLES